MSKVVRSHMSSDKEQSSSSQWRDCEGREGLTNNHLKVSILDQPDLGGLISETNWNLEDRVGPESSEIMRSLAGQGLSVSRLSDRKDISGVNVRKRAFSFGVKALSDGEVLSLLLGRGTRAHSALELAEGLLASIGGMRGFIGRSPRGHLRLNGVGTVKACRLAAAVEMGRRVMSAPLPERVEVHQPEDLRPLLLPHLGGLSREAFFVVLLSARNRVIDVMQVAEGTVDVCVLHPREVFRLAIEAEAAGIILAHNHPSGNPQPSSEDVALTERFRKVASALGVKLLDHVVIAGDKLVSIRAMGHWGDLSDNLSGVVHSPGEASNNHSKLS